MPRIVRPMLRDGTDNNLPRTGMKGRCLGIRVDGVVVDVEVDEIGNVRVNRMGMSVNKNWRDITQPHLIPIELDNGQNGATGRNMAIFIHGHGDFLEGPIADGLQLCHKDETRITGNVCPLLLESVDSLQARIEATQKDWKVDAS